MAVDEARNLKRHSRLHQQAESVSRARESQKTTLVAKATVAVNRSLHRHGVGGGQKRSHVPSLHFEIKRASISLRVNIRGKAIVMSVLTAGTIPFTQPWSDRFHFKSTRSRTWLQRLVRRISVLYCGGRRRLEVFGGNRADHWTARLRGCTKPNANMFVGHICLVG